MPAYRLVSHEICPFVQRAAIVLQAKKVDYDIEYIELQDRPAWFEELSPLGEVPVLQIGDSVLWESQVIAEYLDDVHPPRMHPEDPLMRARHKALIAVISALLPGVMRVARADTEERARVLAARLDDRLDYLEAHTEESAVYYCSDAFQLVDAAIAPLLQRMTWIGEARDFGWFDERHHLAALRDRLMAHDAVRASTVRDIRERVRESFGGWVAAGL